MVGCPTWAPHVVGGGFEGPLLSDSVKVVASQPSDGGDADNLPDDNWRALVRNTAANPVTLHVWAICTTATVVDGN